MKKYPILFFIIFLICGISADGFSCVGSRSLGMGGAFIAVADDAEATYWNPAGISQIKKGEFIWARTLNNRDWINYNDYVGVVLKLGEKKAIGISHIKIDYRMDYVIFLDDNENPIGWSYLRNSTKLNFLSYGSVLGKKGWTAQTFWGFNFKEQDTKFYTEAPKISLDGEKSCTLDISLLHIFNNKLRLGILAQDVIKIIPDFKGYYIKNYRAGVAFKPDKYTIIAADIYNILPEGDFKKEYPDYRVGLERLLKINKKDLAVRAGLYGETFTTFGLGYDLKGLQIDWTVMRDKEQEFTHILTVNKKF